jgi:hypothetical protein
MGPLITERRMSPFLNLVFTQNQGAVECGIPETTGLTFQRDRHSRGSRAEHLYKQHWLHSKEAGQSQELIDTQFNIAITDDSRRELAIKSCVQKAVNQGSSLQSISELGNIVELDPQSLHQKILPEKEDFKIFSSIPLLEDEANPRMVGQRLSELVSQSIKMEADLVLLAEHGKVRYSIIKLI